MNLLLIKKNSKILLLFGIYGIVHTYSFAQCLQQETEVVQTNSGTINNMRTASWTCGNLKYIKTNIHFMLKTDGSGCFTEYDDGKVPANTSMTGLHYAQELITLANNYLSNNAKMNLPAGNTTPNPATNIRYVLTGVYFHRDDNFYSFTTSNMSSGIVNTTYGINKSSELNVYIQDYATSPFYGGIACGFGPPDCSEPWLKLYGVWQKSGTNTITPGYQMATMLNHEVGHTLGLYHTWSGDNCTDTPNNANEWCGGPPTGSNNVMDYNCNQNAITPCQLGIMHNQLDNYYSGLNLLICCSSYPVAAPFSMRSQACNSEKIYLDGSWRTTKSETGYTIEIYQTNAYGSQTILGNYFSQSFSGQYGLINLNQYYSFSSGNFYKVKLTATGGTCNISDSEESWIKVDYSRSFIQNQTISNTQSYFNLCDIIIGSNVDISQAAGNVSVTNTGNITVFSGQMINVKESVHIASGAIAQLKVNPNLSSSITYAYKIGQLPPEQQIMEKFNNETDDIIIFPNPTSELLTVAWKNSSTPPQSIDIFNSLGKKVFGETHFDESGRAHIILQEQNGIYFLKVKYNEKMIDKKIEILK